MPFPTKEVPTGIDHLYLASTMEHKMLIVARSWAQEITDYIIENKIDTLRLSYTRGWKDENLDFLTELKHLKQLNITSPYVVDIQGLSGLSELEYLYLATGNNKDKLDFSVFKKLKDCYFEWLKGSESIFDCLSLEYLCIYGYNGKSFEEISKLINLKRLSIIHNRTLKDLHGIERLIQLENLRLRGMTKLEFVEEISQLKSLRSLWLCTCKKIQNIDFVAELTNLIELRLTNLGEIASLEPILQCKKLEYIDFIDGTTIIDGDLSILERMSSLKKIYFINRRHYSHKQEQFRHINAAATKMYFQTPSRAVIL
jgi:Leucine-rich repeat (LRR) protein